MGEVAAVRDAVGATNLADDTPGTRTLDQIFEDTFGNSNEILFVQGNHLNEVTQYTYFYLLCVYLYRVNMHNYYCIHSVFIRQRLVLLMWLLTHQRLEG